MHIARQTPQELVIVAGSRWVSAICVVGAFFSTYFAIVRDYPKGLLLTAFFLLFAALMDLRKIFIFDATRRVVRWKGRTLSKVESGEISFDDILDIGTQLTKAAHSQGGADAEMCRLTILTPQGTIPMAYTYSGHVNGYAALRRQILEFINSGRAEPQKDHPQNASETS